MTPERLAEVLGPNIYHLAPPESRRQIEMHGLLSPRAQGELLGFDDLRMHRLMTTRRKTSERLAQGHVLNDNSPLSFKRLEGLLENGLSPQDWMEELNSRVFLFPNRKAVSSFLQARANRNRARDLWAFPTLRFLNKYWDKIEVTHMNSGATVQSSPPRRGLSTYANAKELDFDAWRRRRKERGEIKGLDSVKEVCVYHSAPGAAELSDGPVLMSPPHSALT